MIFTASTGLDLGLQNNIILEVPFIHTEPFFMRLHTNLIYDDRLKLHFH